MASTTVIIQQPGAVGGGSGQWSSGLCNICDDMPVCCCGFLCPILMDCYVANSYGESCCLGCVPGSMIAVRTHMRLSYGIQGTISNDAMMICCCGTLELCRMAREMRRHNR
ncbi:cornifelin homolog [Cetorhinus maximus]